MYLICIALAFIFLILLRFVLIKKKNLGQNTVILLTGGCMGIGEQIALNFAKNHKCIIIIVDYRKDLSNSIMKKLTELGSKSYFYQCDLNETHKIKELYDKISLEFSNIDILINNAGIVNGKSHDQCTIQEVQRVINVNYLAPVQLMKLYTKKQQKGHIVNICSITAYAPGVGMSDYCASKAALQKYHESLQLELILKKQDIKMTIINPYMINTGMFEGTKFGLSFIFKTLDMQQVGKMIYESILYNKNQVFLPFYIGLLNFSMEILLPRNLHNQILVFLCILQQFIERNVLKTFKGHKQD